MRAKTPPLLAHLEQTGRLDLLLPEERDLLWSAEVQALPLPEQWDYLATNRRLGYWVTAVVAGLRLVLLAGGATAALVFGGRQAHENWALRLLPLVAVVALLWAVRAAWSARGRLRTLGRSLPPYADLELPEA